MNMGSYNCCSLTTQEHKNIISQLSILKLVAEESRLKILCILHKGKHCVREMIDHLDLSQSLISHHLADLRQAGTVQNEKQGREVYYFLTEKGEFVMQLLTTLSKKEVNR